MSVRHAEVGFGLIAVRERRGTVRSLLADKKVRRHIGITCSLGGFVVISEACHLHPGERIEFHVPDGQINVWLDQTDAC